MRRRKESTAKTTTTNSRDSYPAVVERRAPFRWRILSGRRGKTVSSSKGMMNQENPSAIMNDENTFENNSPATRNLSMTKKRILETRFKDPTPEPIPESAALSAKSSSHAQDLQLESTASSTDVEGLHLESVCAGTEAGVIMSVPAAPQETMSVPKDEEWTASFPKDEERAMSYHEEEVHHEEEVQHEEEAHHEKEAGATMSYHEEAGATMSYHEEAGATMSYHEEAGPAMSYHEEAGATMSYHEEEEEHMSYHEEEEEHMSYQEEEEKFPDVTPVLSRDSATNKVYERVYFRNLESSAEVYLFEEGEILDTTMDSTQDVVGSMDSRRHVNFTVNSKPTDRNLAPLYIQKEVDDMDQVFEELESDEKREKERIRTNNLLHKAGGISEGLELVFTMSSFSTPSVEDSRYEDEQSAFICPVFQQEPKPVTPCQHASDDQSDDKNRSYNYCMMGCLLDEEYDHSSLEHDSLDDEESEIM